MEIIGCKWRNGRGFRKSDHHFTVREFILYDFLKRIIQLFLDVFRTFVIGKYVLIFYVHKLKYYLPEYFFVII